MSTRSSKVVPVIKVIEGIRLGVERALTFLAEAIIPIDNLTNPILQRIALVAARDHQDLAQLVVQAARIIGTERLTNDWFKLSDQVVALEGSESDLIQGMVINREPLNREMPRRLMETKILIIDDALEPLKVDNEALATEAGFNQQLHNEQELTSNIRKLGDLGVRAIITDRAICDLAEDLLTDLGIIGVQGVAAEEWHRLAEMTGARPIKKSSLAKSSENSAKISRGSCTDHR